MRIDPRHEEAGKLPPAEALAACQGGALRAASPCIPSGRLPLRRRGAVARSSSPRRARATSPQNPAMRLPGLGDSVGMPALPGLRESAPPLLAPRNGAVKPGKEALHRRPIRDSSLFCGGSVEAVGRIRQKMRIGLHKRLNAVHRRDVQKGQEGAFR